MSTMINESPHNPRSQGICPYDAERWTPTAPRHKERYPWIEGELSHKVQKCYEYIKLYL